MKPEEPKRRQSKFEREQRRRRLLSTLIALVIVVASGLVAYGYYDTQVKPWNQTIAEVNDVKIDMRYFVKMLPIWLEGQQSSYRAYMAQMVAEQILPEYELRRQIANELGIEVTVEELDAELDKLFGYDAEEMTVEEFNKLLEDRYNLKRAEIRNMLIEPWVLEKKLQEYIGEQHYPEGTTLDHVKIEAMLVGTEEKAMEMRSKWDTTGFSTLVNQTSPSGSYPDPGDDKDDPEDDVDWLPAGIESDAFDEYAFADTTVIGELSMPIRDTSYWTTGGYWLVKVLEISGEGDDIQVHVRAILVDSQKKANELRDDIIGGEDFAEVAKEHSLHSSKESGGDIGFLKKQDMTSNFGSANVDKVLALAVDGVSEPLLNEATSKQSGYWVIKVLDKKNDAPTEDHRTSLVSNKYREWFEEEKGKADIKVYLDGEAGTNRLDWALKRIS